MKRYLFPAKVPFFLVHLLILVSLVVSSCGGAASAPQAEAPAAAATEAPAAAATAAPAMGESVGLTFLYPGTSDSAEGQFVSDMVARFQEANPAIFVDLQFVSSSDYRAKLYTQVAAGDPPDLAKINYYDLVQLYGGGNLMPLEQLGSLDSDFLNDALDSAWLGENHYGLPQWRDSCSLAYDYLSIFSAASYPREAFRLLQFLTDSDTQVQAFKTLSWYPTRQSAYDSLGLGCSVNQAIRVPPDQIQTIIDQVQQRSPALEPVLDGGVVLAEQSTGVFENGELVGFGAAVWSSISAQEARDRMGSSGLVMGVLFINNVEEYPSGDYVVKCFTDYCVLVDQYGNQTPYDLLLSEEMDTPVQVPRVALVPGSKIECKWYWFWRRCTRVG